MYEKGIKKHQNKPMETTSRSHSLKVNMFRKGERRNCYSPYVFRPSPSNEGFVFVLVLAHEESDGGIDNVRSEVENHRNEKFISKMPNSKSFWKGKLKN